MNKLNKYFLIAAVTLSAITATAREKYGNAFKTASPQKVMANCNPAQSSAELRINNVRTIIYSGSDMWWDLFGGGNAWYLVPKVEDRTKGANCNFAGNVWFGGIDVGNQLKIAAQTYRQQGVDFWTGPLSTIDATTNSDVCQKYDLIYKLNRVEVDNFVLSGGEVTSNIKNWPGNGDISLNHDPQLAPYIDTDGDSYYNPEAGDYPYYDVYNTGLKDNEGVCKARVFGDETLWWVYNDNGSNHIATGGKAIGMEIRAQAFAFKTTDDINNMTFYNYQLINRSSFDLNNTYMTVWTDADLGYYLDDYIGCDVKRGLGYIYNADNFDESVGGVLGYGNYIPAFGCDFFQGPKADPFNLIDDDNDGVIDELGEQMGMSKFLYFNNSFPTVPLQQTDPNNATQYYQYMTGFWKDGTPFTCGGNGYGGSIQTSFVYPANTDPANTCGNWSESGTPGDRRFMQSSGPFTLKAGAVNYVTYGLPFARTTTTDPKASIDLLKIADDKAQALFDNCFRVLSGPEAPDMTIQELNNELIIYFSNKPASNNYLNQYTEKDVSIIVDPTHFGNNYDKFYRFEGYRVYQLKNNLITQEELMDVSKAKLVFNCDLKNGISRLINYEFDATTGGDIPRVKVDVTDNSDKGIQSTYHFTKDLFSSAQDKKVVNNKEYYFFCVAYGYNQYGEYKEDLPFTAISTNTLTGAITYPASSEGQKRPYLEGRKSKKAYGIPHNPAPEKEGSITNSGYGYGPKITRLEGQGNGGNNLELTQASIDNILANGDRVDQITYENGRGPINIKVVDPLNVPNADFTIKLINRNWFYKGGLTAAQINDTLNSDPCKTSNLYKNLQYPLLKRSNALIGRVNEDTATWVLKNLSNNKEYYPCKSLKIGEEYYFSELGLSVTIGGTRDIANISFPYNSATDKIINADDIIGASMSFENSNQSWLSGVADVDGSDAFNWIRSGTFKDNGLNGANNNDYQVLNMSAGSDVIFADQNQYLEGILGGTWAPYALTAASKTTTPLVEAAPAFPNLVRNSTNNGTTFATLLPTFDLRTLASVDIVLTKDKSKWTRSMVLEECDEANSNPSRAKKLEVRRNKSVDKQGIPIGEAGCNFAEALIDTFNYGCGWFPGYAVNLETGERLNIAFGEDSYQANNNGNDMMWNPNHVVSENNYRYAFGGRHYIYVFGNNRSGTKYGGQNVPTVIDGKLIGSGTYASFVDLVTTYKIAYNFFSSADNNVSKSGSVQLTNIWSDAMWVNIPVTAAPSFNFKNPTDMPCGVKVSLRVKKAYRPSIAGNVFVRTSRYTSAGYINGTTALDGSYAPVIQPYFPISNITNDSMEISRDILANPINNNYGLYKFSTADIFTEIGNADKSKSALDLINVVPNPYYAYSAYEKSRIENTVRITNLPNKCRIKIFTLNGTLVRTFNRDLTGQEDILINESDFVHSKRLPFQDWDLKNQNGISVASGLYIIYVDVPGVGEKILKWFGVMRPLDLQSY